MKDFGSATLDMNVARMRGDGFIAEAGWFGPRNRPRFGWLYQPDAPDKRIGVVIVPPFGYEAACTHRSLKHLAEDAARAGFIAVRFDLDGTGDSAGGDTDPGRVAAWIASIQDACDLARSAGCGRVLLVGARLGATLAALAAAARDDVAALVAINAVTRGRAFLREARALQAAMSLRAPTEPQPDDGSQDVIGHTITCATCTQLCAIDLGRASKPPAKHVLLIERDDLPEREHWPARLRQLGVDVEIQRLPGLVEMFDAPHFARVPQHVLDACVACARQAAEDPSATAGSPRPVVSLHVSANFHASGAAISERVVLVDDAMFGIVVSPLAAKPTTGTVLLNAGSVSHKGPNRMYVEWSRRWAACGGLVLRADLSGLGDSATRSGAKENQVFGIHGIDDAKRMALWLRAQGIKRVVAGGACSGAYHALRAAIASDAINAFVLINPGALRDIGVVANEATMASNGRYYNNHVSSGRAWRKLVGGQVSPQKLARVLRWYTSTYGGAFRRELLRKLHWPMRGDLGAELQALARRGVDMYILFSADDNSRALLTIHAGSTARRLARQGHLHIQIFDGPDHTFTQHWAQVRLHETLHTISAVQVRRCR